MNDPKRVNMAGGFKPGDMVMVRRYSPKECRIAKVAYYPPEAWFMKGMVPVLYGEHNDDSDSTVEMEPVPADDLSLIESPKP